MKPTDKKVQQVENFNFSSDESIDDDDDDDEDDLILEGVLIRNKEVPSSSSEDDSNTSEDDDVDEEVLIKHDIHKTLNKRKKTTSNTLTTFSKEVADGHSRKMKKGINQKSNKNQKDVESNEEEDDDESNDDDDIGKDDLIQVEFTFHDMDEKFFHGLKMLLLSIPLYAPLSSDLADEMIENISVGTIVSCDDGAGDNVYGFASVLPIVSPSSSSSSSTIKDNNNNKSTAQEQVIQQCIDQCPEQYKAEMKIVTSGSTQRPAGIFLHGRMVNLPLEITFILHQQLVLDIDWAIEHAEGGEMERKRLDFGAFILLAPCYLDPMTQKVTYKNFDDEIFANCAEFVYTLSHPSSTTVSKSMNHKKRNHSQSTNSNSMEKDESNMTNVIVLTKTGHRQGLKEMNELVHGRTMS